MIYPIPMQVHVIWHPDSHAVCRSLADAIYLALNRDPYQPLLPGIGIPVFFRCAGADREDRAGAPLPILLPDTKLDLRIALVTSQFAMSSAWMEYLDRSAAEVAKNPQNAVLLCFDLTSGALEGARLAIRLDPEASRFAEQAMQHVLLQCCRLLGGRVRGGGGSNRGAAPLKLFLSHTKRDEDGLTIARAVKRYLDQLAVDRFFDEVSIQPGDELSEELKAEIDDSTLVCVRTDGYVSSPWCRKELALGKRNRRPMVVLDALSRREPRASPLLNHLPSIRVNVGDLGDFRIEAIVNFIGLEVVRYLYATQQLDMLQKAGLVPADAILLTRPPETRDLASILKALSLPRTTPPTMLHPDPMLAAEEAGEFEPFGVAFVTPTGLWRKRLEGLQLGLSLSSGDAAEQEALGLSLHIEDAMRGIVRQALAAGATLHYGGTLEEGSLTQSLFDLIGAYNRDGLKLPPLVNHTPWPWYEEVDQAWLAKRRLMLKVEKCPPPDDLKEMAATPQAGRLAALLRSAEGRYALGRTLTAMRRRNIAATQARVVLGGKPHGFVGFLPGIVEEVLFAIAAGQPVYVLGGFGGGARLVADALGGGSPRELTRDYQVQAAQGYAETLDVYERERTRAPELVLPALDYSEVVATLMQYGTAGLSKANGLSEEENRFLFGTASVDAALYLTMKGLAQVKHE